MSEYLLKSIKYILPSSKDWTGVGILSHGNVYLHSTSISGDFIVLSIKLVIKSQTQLGERHTSIKEPPLMTKFWAFGKNPDIDC
jgi:hypothetical protein